MPKPYLVTLSTKTPGRDRFLKSLKNIDVEYIPVEFVSYPGHFFRHDFVPKDLDPSRYVIFTDTDDVIFQKELPELTADIYLAPESVTHDITMWGKVIAEYPIFSPLLNLPVYNCGMYIMKVPILYEYLKFLHEFPDGGYKRFNVEQLHFNMFINLHPEYSKVIDQSILCPLYGNLYLKIVRKEDGIWKYGDKTICCVHANGNNKELL